MSNKNLVSIFNEHLVAFFDDVQSIFPDNVDILTGKNSILAFRKINPALLIRIWATYIASVYSVQIENNDVSFFLSKDYSTDLTYANNAEKIMETINRLREPISKMNPEDQIKTMKYIKNLSKMSMMHVNQNSEK
jgi:hypothetical protein